MTTILTERDGIRYTLLGAEDLDEVARLVAHVFTDGSEPVTRQLHIGPREFVLLIKAFTQKFIREGLSIVARDVRTSEVVAAQLNDDMGTQNPDLADVYEWAAPVLALLEQLDRRYFADRAVEPNIYAHFFFIAVLPSYRGRGIASQLLELSLAIASRNGYRKATVEATGLVSQHVLHKAGFEPRVEIPYATFEYNGNRPFQGIKDHPSVLFMDRGLTLDRQPGEDKSRLIECAGPVPNEDPMGRMLRECPGAHVPG
jgi:ribosomal protein S18 acetylase RimI-like enzyme